jgi:hypothetical protein
MQKNVTVMWIFRVTGYQPGEISSVLYVNFNAFWMDFFFSLFQHADKFLGIYTRGNRFPGYDPVWWYLQRSVIYLLNILPSWMHCYLLICHWFQNSNLQNIPRGCQKEMHNNGLLLCIHNSQLNNDILIGVLPYLFIL